MSEEEHYSITVTVYGMIKTTGEQKTIVDNAWLDLTHTHIREIEDARKVIYDMIEGSYNTYIRIGHFFFVPKDFAGLEVLVTDF